MRPAEHIALLRSDIGDMNVFAEHLEDFSDDHHVGMDQWFEQEWASLLLAETNNEKKTALDNLAKQYERIEQQENTHGNGNKS